MGKYGNAVDRVSTSGFYKFESGDNRIRFLSDPVVQNKTFPNNAMPQTIFSWYIWDYRTNAVAILSKGGSFLRNLDAVMEEWGEDLPMKCDVNIKKSGSGMQTKYTWVASPVKDELPKEWDNDIKPLEDILENAITIEEFGNGTDPTTDFNGDENSDQGGDPFEGMDTKPVK